MSDNHKQFGSYLEAVMEAIQDKAGKTYRPGQAFFIEEIEAGLREVLGNADHVFWAAEEAFRAGHQACLKETVPALLQDPTHVPQVERLWQAYTPSEAVVDRVQMADA